MVLGGLGLGAACLPWRSRAEIVDFVVIGKDGWLFAIFDQNRSFDPAQMPPVIACINEAVDILKRAGIATAITITPAKSRIYAEYLPADFLPTAEAEKRYAAARGMLAGSGALVPDLAAVMLDAKRANPAAPVFLKADTHWTGEGAEACAAAVARAIATGLRLPPGERHGDALGPATTMRQGINDLADDLPDALGKTYGPQLYHIHPPLPVAAASGLLDDSTPDVLLVGNSFMQPRYNFAPMLSNQLNRPVSLAWRVHQASPYRTLLEALGAAPYRRQKPKLLVWDFEETDVTALPDSPGVWGPNGMPAADFLSRLRALAGG
jgi:alginate O-acetyltransferase complex protein AlgJ